MSIALTSPHFQFSINPDRAAWSLYGCQANAPEIENAWMRVNYQLPSKAVLRTGQRHFEILKNWPRPEIYTVEQTPSPHGSLEILTIALQPDANGVRSTLEFALPQNYPIFLWRIRLENHGGKPLEIEQLTMMQAGSFPKRKWLPKPAALAPQSSRQPIGSGIIRPHPSPGKPAFFTNGWQSWSFSGALGAPQRAPDTRLGFFAAPMWYNRGTPRPKQAGHFASDMFGVLGDRLHRTGILAGFLSQKEHFGSLEAYADPLYPALSLWANGDQARLEPGAQIITDWAVIQFVDMDAPDPLAPYLEAVARQHEMQPSTFQHPPAAGWCSWYQFYQDISAKKMRANLQTAAKMQSGLPLDLFQIDDGFQSQIGDWLTFSPTFPQGVKPLAEEIQEAGFTPGLWLAPFIVHSKSQLKRQHPDWLLRNRYGQTVNAGFVWNNFNTALDLTHPEALDYVRKVVHTATHIWGYSFLKLDFLFAAAVSGRYQDRTKTRAQVLRKGLETLREAAGPDVHLLGCGVPLGASIGIFDSMRIGADVDPGWLPSFGRFGRHIFQKEYSMPSTRNAIQNALTRAPMHQRWWINDPDCLLVRPDSKLSLAEVQSLATVIALTGGPLLLSDDLPKLPAERLRIARQMLPLIGQRGRVLDWFDTTTPRLLRLDLENATGKWHLLAIFNWDDQSQDAQFSLDEIDLPEGEYLTREFWTGETSRISEGILTLKGIPAHGVRLLALHPFKPDRIYYLGSDLHISQGLEVIQWTPTPQNLQLRLERPGETQGQIELYLPQPPTQVQINKNESHWQSSGTNHYQINIKFEQSAELLIIW